jgi:hypothetical protein
MPSQLIAVHDDIERDQNVLATFNSRVRPSGGVLVPLAPASTCALWLAVFWLAYGGWLLACDPASPRLGAAVHSPRPRRRPSVPALVLPGLRAALTGAMPVSRGLFSGRCSPARRHRHRGLCGLIALSGVAVLLGGGAPYLMVSLTKSRTARC